MKPEGNKQHPLAAKNKLLLQSKWILKGASVKHGWNIKTYIKPKNE